MATGWGKHLSTLGRLGGAVLRATLGRIMPGTSTPPAFVLPLSATVTDVFDYGTAVADVLDYEAGVTDVCDYQATVSPGAV